jgi:simple sugar transport system substrate-binding protein
MYKNLVAGAVALLAACAFAQVGALPPVASSAAGHTPRESALAQAPANTPAQTPKQTQTQAPVKPLKVGYVYLTPVLPTGWTQQHEQARQAVQRQFGDRVQTTVVADVPEGPDAERVIRELASQGHGLIVTTSFGYAQPALRVAREFPQVKFETLTGQASAPNVATANARLYEGRYLAGLLAGLTSPSGQAGFVVGLTIPEVVQGVNAFALGMRSVNPQAQVHVVVLGEWFNPGRERAAAMTLMDQGADVLAFQTATESVMRAAEARGKHAIAFHSDMSAAAPKAQLAAITHHWDRYEISSVQAVLDGRWQGRSTSGGVREGMVRVGHFGPDVPERARQRVMAAQADLAQGKLQPFRGPLRDRDGRVRVPAGQVASEAQLRSMDWWVPGVVAAKP